MSCTDLIALTVQFWYFPGGVQITKRGVRIDPLVFSTSRQGKLKAASVDYISHIVRDAIIRMRMGTMQTAHIRGASTSKVVQLVPNVLVNLRIGGAA
jgi:C-terminal processing protease CtpA/Prc